MERISVDAGTQFIFTEFQDICQTRGVSLTLADPEHQEMNGQVEVTWIRLRTIVHSLMVHAGVLEACINFALVYTEDHILPVLPRKYLINKDGEPTTPFKLATGTKPSVSNLWMLFCPCIVQIATANVEKKALNVRPQEQKGFRGIFVGIRQHQKGYLVNVSQKCKIVSLHNIVFDESFSSALAYTSQPYAEEMSMRLSGLHIPYDTYSRGKTVGIITFAQFEEGIHDLKLRIYYLKLVTIQKAVMNMMKIQLCHHLLVINKWMRCHQAMSLILNPCL